MRIAKWELRLHDRTVELTWVQQRKSESPRGKLGRTPAAEFDSTRISPVYVQDLLAIEAVSLSVWQFHLAVPQDVFGCRPCYGVPPYAGAWVAVIILQLLRSTSGVRRSTPADCCDE